MYLYGFVVQNIDTKFICIFVFWEMLLYYIVSFRVTRNITWSQSIWRLANYSSAGVDIMRFEEWTRFGRQEDLESLHRSLAWYYFAELCCSNLWTVGPLRMRASGICVWPFDFRFTTRATWFCVCAIFNLYRPENVFVAYTRNVPHLLGIGLWWHRKPVW